MSPQAVVILHQCNYTLVNNPQETPAQRPKKDHFDEFDMAYVTQIRLRKTTRNIEGVTLYRRSGNCEALIAPHISCCFSTTFFYAIHYPRHNVTPFVEQTINQSPCGEEVDKHVNYHFVQGKTLWKTLWKLVFGDLDPNRLNCHWNPIQNRSSGQGIHSEMIRQNVRIHASP